MTDAAASGFFRGKGLALRRKTAFDNRRGRKFFRPLFLFSVRCKIGKTIDLRACLYYNKKRVSDKKRISAAGEEAPRPRCEKHIERFIMVVKVCVGSSCHLRGSYDVIEEMKRLIKKYGVEDKIDLQATFCVGNCTHGVSVLADEAIVHDANKDNCEELFLTQIYPLVK